MTIIGKSTHATKCERSLTSPTQNDKLSATNEKVIEQWLLQKLGNGAQSSASGFMVVYLRVPGAKAWEPEGQLNHMMKIVLYYNRK